MQRCPYLHEMKERLLGEQMTVASATEPLTTTATRSSSDHLHVQHQDVPTSTTPAHHQQPPHSPLLSQRHYHLQQQQPLLQHHMMESQPVGTVVRLNADGYSSHTSPAHQRTPLMPRDHDDDFHCVQQTSWRPKNAKTSLFIITSFIYAKLLVVVCIAYVISDVVTHNLPLYYYEGFFTYLYGMSILFLLYVFCFLLQESTCCAGQDNSGGGATVATKKVKKPPPDKKDKKEKEKEKKEKEKKEKEKKEKEKEKTKDKDKDKKNKKSVQREVFPKKMRDLVAQRRAGVTQTTRATTQTPTYRRNSEVDATIPVPVLELESATATTTPTLLADDIDASVGCGDYNHEADDKCVMSPQESQPQQTPQPPPPPPTAQQQVALQQQQPQQQVAPAPVQDIEMGLVVTKSVRKRKTTQNDSSHGSFFLRIGAIAFGLGTMIYNGLEFGSFFEVPFTSPCYQILRGVNPVLQMIFTFMQMYFIFMNSRLNIHRFKVIARFGLMHVVATNICVWIRTLVLEYLKEITAYYKRNQTFEEGILTDTIRSHLLRYSSGGADVPYYSNSNVGNNNDSGVPSSIAAAATVASHLFTRSTSVRPTIPTTTTTTTAATTARTLATMPLRYAAKVIRNFSAGTTTTTTTPVTPSLAAFGRNTMPSAPTVRAYPKWAALRTTLTSTLSSSSVTTSTTTPAPITTTPTTTTTTTNSYASTIATTPFRRFFGFDFDSSLSDETSNAIIGGSDSNVIMGDAAVAAATNSFTNDATNSLFSSGASNIGENFSAILPQALTATVNGTTTDLLPASCGRLNIMGTIVQDSAPYLFPFIIEYSLIGAAVIYVMWKHIGRNPSRYMTEEDLEHRLEVMLSRRAVAMAHAQHGRVDCVGASKGLFFGLLLLVGSLICLILFFVLIRHPNLSLLAIYLADVSHCVLMTLSIFAIIIGFISIRTSLRTDLDTTDYRVQGLKFRTEEQNDLNDILLRVSAFGLFIYAVFSVIAGSLAAFTHEPNLLVMITGLLSIVQVVLQLLFIADVSRRRVHLPEHDRSKPGRQIVTFLLICNVTMWIIYTFEMQKVEANPVQLDFYGFFAWAIVQRVTLPLCIFHRFHSAVTLAEIWKTSYKARLE